MTVEELIEQLKLYPQDSSVYFSGTEDDSLISVEDIMCHKGLQQVVLFGDLNN